MRTKRSQIEYGINWIFVIVAGGLILLFFLSIGLMQKRQSEVEISNIMADAIAQAMVTGLISERYYNEFQRLGSFSFQSICIQEFAGYFFNDAKKELNFIFFAPPISRSGDATIWAVKWKISYSITNIIYLLFSGNKIIIVNSSRLSYLCDNLKVLFHPKANVECVNSFEVFHLRTKLSKEVIDSLTVVTELNNITIYDLKDIVASTKRKVNDNNLRIIRLNSSTIDYGRIIFIGTFGQKEFMFSHISELLGAIVSSDPLFYECMVKKRSQLNLLISKIYMEKSSNLIGYSSSCNPIYQGFMQQLREIAQYDANQEYFTNFSKLEEYVNKHRALETFNKQLIWNNCEILI